MMNVSIYLAAFRAMQSLGNGDEIMARLKNEDGSVDIEISTFDRPHVWFDPNKNGDPKTDQVTRFNVSYPDTIRLAQHEYQYMWIKLAENETVLWLRGRFWSLPLEGGDTSFHWDACQWFEANEERLWTDGPSYVFRYYGHDHLAGRRWALGLEDQ